MQKTFIFVSGVCILLHGASVEALAGNRHYEQAQKILSYSLESLKESAQTVADENAWYYGQIRALEERTAFLTNEIRLTNGYREDWSTEESHLSAYLSDADTQQVFYDKNFDRLQYEFLAIEEDVSRLNQMINKKESEIDQMSVKVREVEERNVNLRQGEGGYGSLAFNDPVIGGLANDKKYLRQKTTQLEKELKQMKKKYAKPLKAVFEQRDIHKQLEQQRAIAHDELKILSGQEKKIIAEIKLNESQELSRFEDTKQRIKFLKSRKSELSGVIKKAESRIDRKDFNSNKEAEDIRSLGQNLATIRDENASLKARISKLHSSLSLK